MVAQLFHTKERQFLTITATMKNDVNNTTVISYSFNSILEVAGVGIHLYFHFHYYMFLTEKI